MADLSKDREEKITVGVDFSSALDTDDGVSAIESVEVTVKQGGESARKHDRGADVVWANKSSEFGSPSGVLDGDTVEVDLSAAGASGQKAGLSYTLRVTVSTNLGDTLIATPTLDVTAKGDTDAP